MLVVVRDRQHRGSPTPIGGALRVGNLSEQLWGTSPERHQLLTCGCRFDEDGSDPDGTLLEVLGVDGNGMPVELRSFGGTEVIVHYDDVPESDLTTLDGIRVTTPLRTVIDLAPELPADDLRRMVQDSLDRGLFTVEEAERRLAEPDMRSRRGAELVREVLRERA